MNLSFDLIENRLLYSVVASSGYKVFLLASLF